MKNSQVKGAPNGTILCESTQLRYILQRKAKVLNNYSPFQKVNLKLRGNDSKSVNESGSERKIEQHIQDLSIKVMMVHL